MKRLVFMYGARGCAPGNAITRRNLDESDEGGIGLLCGWHADWAAAARGGARAGRGHEMSDWEEISDQRAAELRAISRHCQRSPQMHPYARDGDTDRKRAKSDFRRHVRQHWNDLGAHFESTVQDRNRTDSIRPRPVSPESHREGAHLPLYCLKMFADCRFKGSSELFLCAATDLHEFWIPSQAHAIQPLHA